MRLPTGECEHRLCDGVELEVGDKGGEIEVAEEVALVGAQRLGHLIGLLRVLAQLLHLGDEDLVAAIGVCAACAGAGGGCGGG